MNYFWFIRLFTRFSQSPWLTQRTFATGWGVGRRNGRETLMQSLIPCFLRPHSQLFGTAFAYFHLLSGFVSIFFCQNRWYGLRFLLSSFVEVASGSYEITDGAWFFSVSSHANDVRVALLTRCLAEAWYRHGRTCSWLVLEVLEKLVWWESRCGGRYTKKRRLCTKK